MATNTNTNVPPNIDIGNPYTPRRPAPLISISVNHPLAKAARKIKNFLIHKQTLFSTTFTIKVTPIVAMVSLVGVAALFGGGITTAFNFGKTVEQRFLATLTPSPSPIPPTPIQNTLVNTSKTGIVKATYQLPAITPTQIPNTPTPTGSGSTTIVLQPTPTPSLQVLHYILVAKNGAITYLASSSIQLQNYLGLRVLVTGMLDTNKNTLTITKATDIEVLQ